MVARDWHSGSRSSGAVVGAALALIIAATSTSAQPATVILVRHAERAATPANDPELTPAGGQRARDLLAALAGAQVTSVVTTHLQRTTLTARPVLDAIGKAPIVIPARGPSAAHIEAVVAAVRSRPAGEVVLVVGHSNTVPGILAALGGPRLPDLCDSQYASLFVLQLRGSGPPTFIHAKYGAPDPPDSDACARTMR
jgi:broad specificity phosphatase PhoE